MELKILWCGYSIFRGVEPFCRHIDQRSTPDSNPGTEATSNAGDPRGFRTEYVIRICNVHQVPETTCGSLNQCQVVMEMTHKESPLQDMAGPTQIGRPPTVR